MPVKKTSSAKNKNPPASAPVKSAQGSSDDNYDNSINLDADVSLPIDFSNKAFTATSGGDYYPFFAPDDNLFLQLIQLRLLSPTQSNCIQNKTHYTTGGGLQVRDKPFPKDFERKINGKNEIIDEVLKGIGESFYQDGNAFIEVSRITFGKDKYVHAYKHNNLDCRYAVPEKGEDPTHVLRSKDFRRNGILKFGKKDTPAIKIPIWTDNPVHVGEVWVTDENNPNVERTMLIVKNKVESVDYYGLPTNFAGFMAALLEYNAARLNVDDFENNMFLAGIFTVMGQMTALEEKKVMKDIRNIHRGKGKQRRVLTASSEAGLSDTKFTPFTQTHEGHFIQLDKHYEGKIVNANEWDKDLLSMNETSGLSKGGAYLSQLFKIKYATVIKPAQDKILNSFVFPMMKIIDDFKGTKFYEMDWILQPIIPVSLEGILDINSLLTVDEGRKELNRGDHPDPEVGKKQISQVAVKTATPAAADDTATDPKTKKEAKK